jgi:DNA polymerase-3 subunit alpha
MMSFPSTFSKYTIENYGYIRLPEIKITDEQRLQYGLTKESSNLDFLKALAREGFKLKSNKIPKAKYKEYGDRLKYELLILEELGFVDYILLVWQVVNKAREFGTFIDYGRGSVAGCALCWLLQISGVDPIDKSLYFERFVSRARAGTKYINGNLYLKGDLLADVDLNLGDGISKIVEHLNHIYPNRVSKIINFSTFTTKILLKDVYKSLKEVNEFEAKEISDMVEVHFGIAQTINEVKETNAQFNEWCSKNPDVVQVCEKLSGLLRQTSTHASGHLIGYYPLNDLIPLEITKDGELISSYDMIEVSNFFCKLDLLGLATNKILREVRDVIPEKFDSINLDDNEFIYSKFQNNDLLPYGLYQISADCAYGVLNKIKPRNISELSDVSAIARPGALAYQFGYALNNHPCPHPAFEKILAPTRNYCLSGDTEIFNIRDGKFYKIRDIKNISDFEVQSVNENYLSEKDSITNWVCNGEKDVLEMTLQNGRAIKATRDHEILTDNGWKKLGDIKDGEYVACPKNLIQETKFDLSYDRLRIIAYLIAEGTMGPSCINDFTNSDPILFNAYKEAVSREFDTVTVKERDQVRNVKRIEVVSKISRGPKANDFCQWLRDIGMKKADKTATRSYEKSVPPFIFMLPKDKILFFLACLWDCDGHCGKYTWFYKTISPQLATDVYNLLQICGYSPATYTFKYQNKKRNKKTIFTSHQISIYNLVDFKRDIGKYLLSNKNIESNISLANKSNGSSISSLKVLNKELWETIARIGPLKSVSKSVLGNHILGNLKAKSRKGEFRMSKSSFDNLSKVADLSKYQHYFNINWVKVTKIKDAGRELVYDISVSKNRNFIANGIVVHNCLYQETMMQMAVAVGFSLEEAEQLRKVVGKKLVDKVKEWKDKIYERCKINGFGTEIGDILWKILEDSAKYSFNKSHSLATSYLSALTVYLKYKYPVEFYWACLKNANNLAAPLDEITAIQKELQHFGIKLLPPDIIKSEFDYTIEDGNIRTGISSLRNLSDANLEKLKSFKATATNKFELFMSCQNAKLPLGVISSLILSGAFDGFVKDSRNRLLFEYEIWNELTPREIPIINGLGPKYNYDLPAIIRACAEELKNEKGAPLIKESRRETLRKNCQGFVLKFKANSRFEELTAYIAENHYLGFSYSHSLKSIYSKHIHDLYDLKELAAAPAGDYKVVAQLVELEERVSKASKKTYVKYNIKDDVGSVSVLSFSLDSREAMVKNNGRMIKSGDIAVWHVTKKCKGDDGVGNHTDSIHFVQDIVIQDVPTVLKVSEIRKELEKEEGKV